MSDDFTGKTLGQYEVAEEIGRGGMATVYKARQTSINRTVAVKVLPRSLLHDPGFYERFEREVDVIAHLEHPHILPIYDFGRDEGVPYIVMRFLAGGSLQELLHQGPAALDNIEKPFVQVASALDHAHQQGIIHRDLKPANIMLDESGNAYLTDFGIARVLGSELTGSMLIGTPAYMSPEQAGGQPLDARSDIYALGVVLFEIITGREPYQAETPMALLLKHINEPIPPVSDFRQDVPPALEMVIHRATAKAPADRFASAGEMAEGLREALRAPTSSVLTPLELVAGSEPTAALPTSPPPSTAAPVSEPALQPPVVASRLPTLAIGLIGLVVLIVGAGAAALFASGALEAVPAPTLDYAATFAAESAQLPTAFPGSQQVETERYTIAVPASPLWSGPLDRSDEARSRQVWQASDGTAFVSLSLLAADLDDTQQFRQSVTRYHQRYYETDDRLSMIDEAVAPDGTLRRSFRLHNPAADPFPSGQVDVFFLQRDPWLTVIEVYSADSAGNEWVPIFQSILDSLRVKHDLPTN